MWSDQERVMLGLSPFVGDAVKKSTRKMTPVGAPTRKARRGLESELTRLRQAFDAAGAGTWEWDLQSNRVEWSPTFKAIFGLQPDAEVTRDLLLSMMHAVDRPGVEANLRNALDNHGEYRAEYRIRRPDGVERWVGSRGRGEYDDAGRPVRMVGAAVDVSERRMAQRELRRSEARFRSLVEATAQIVWLADLQGMIVSMSPAFKRFTGVEPERANGTGWLEVIHPDDRERSIAVWTHSLQTGEHYHNEFRARMADGNYRYFEANAVPVREVDGGIREWIGTANDVHDRKLAEAALNTAHQELERKVVEHQLAEAATRRLNRVYAVLSGINGLIVRGRNQRELFEGACRIAVEEGRFLMAWIGRVKGDRVEPVAIHGANDGYVESIDINLSSRGTHGRGPTALALHEKRPRICNDLADDPDFAPWREAALARGFRSSAALPLVVGNQITGCICLYAGETGFFDEGEVALLTELAGDLSYALEFIAREAQLDYLAYYDSLTRLANRRLFADRLNQFLQSARQNGEGFAVMMLDLARFKTFNDMLGMAGGDELIKLIARRLTRFAGGSGRLARVGGDRFAAIAPDFRQAANLSAMLRERVWNALNRPYRLAGQELRVSVRIGVAMFPDDGDDADSLIQNAEAALKKAKASGENYLFYTQQMSAVLKEKLRLEGQLRRALDESEFVLYYQPKLDLRDGSICGAEALLRWNSPELGLVPPAQFMPLLEETGMILEVGRWVLQNAAAQHARWLAEGVIAPSISVNVSPLQLREPDFVSQVRNVVPVRGGREPAGIELEVTESVLMPDMQQHIGKLVEVREMGVKIAIDDFGTGYSSLSYLSRLPVTAVKIDRSFTVGMTDNADTMNIVSTIISLSRSMNLRVIAEGVDSVEQLKFLRLLRCDEIQGFLFSPAVPADQFADMLREGRRLS